MFTPIKDRIEYGGAMIGKAEKDAIYHVIESQGGKRWTVGPESIALEQELAEVTGVKRAVLTNSGSSALLVAMTALHLKKGSRIIIPAVNFPTAFNAILQIGCIPVVVDADIKTLNIDLRQVENALILHPDIVGVIAVDIAGNPVDLIALRDIVGERRKIIMDNCIAEGTLIKTINGDVPIEKIKVGDKVLTRNGYRSVLKTMDKGFQDVITKIGVTATPDHKFITNKGKKELNVLNPSDILYVWNETSSSIEEESLSAILKQNRGIERSTSMMEKNFTTDNYGKITLEKFLKDISSTIKTITRLIMNYRIYNVLLQNNTLEYTSQKMDGSISQRGTSLKQEMEQLRGTNQKKEKSFMQNIIDGFGRLEKKQKNFVRFVAKSISLFGQQNLSSVQRNVKHVYDLTIEKDHEFFANNILVSNCDGYGTTLENKFIETYADISAVSFHAAHIITMGEGGAVLTNDEELGSRALKLREWGRASGTDKIYDYPGFPDDYKERYVYEEIGFNMKPLELQCAMGRVQLKRLREFKFKRLENYFKMYDIFKRLPKFDVIECIEDAIPCWFSFPIMCRGVSRRIAMETFEKNNIECRTIFSGNILKHPAYKDIEAIQIGNLHNANDVMANGMFLSVHPSITQEMIDFIKEVAESL